MHFHPHLGNVKNFRFKTGKYFIVAPGNWNNTHSIQLIKEKTDRNKFNTRKTKWITILLISSVILLMLMLLLLPGLMCVVAAADVDGSSGGCKKPFNHSMIFSPFIRFILFIICLFIIVIWLFNQRKSNNVWYIEVERKYINLENENTDYIPTTNRK